MKTTVLFLCLLTVLGAPGRALAESCISTACHTQISGLKYRHAPVEGGECSTCHVQQGKEHPVKGGKTFKIAGGGKEICVGCHSGIAKQKVVHPPVNEGDCLSCHKPHGGSGRYLLDVGPDLGALCYSCHDQAPYTKKYVHGPVAEGTCLACHSPHDSANKFLLKDGMKELCLGCHEDFAKEMKMAKRVHSPVKDKPCTSCHDPHSGDYRYLLKEKMPDLCMGCHKDLDQRLKASKGTHKPVLEGKGCSNCHSTHFSKEKGLLIGEQKEVCLGCHGSDKVGNPALKNIAQELSGKKQQHGPIAKGRCDGCHDPHASNYGRLLTGAYPDGFYAAYRDGAYGLCLKCHDKNLLTFKETTMYTKFRNGDSNLHFVHVADRSKGRTCRTCHEIHASSGDALVATEGTRFGKWKVQTRFKKTATGGGCAPGCHKPYQYDRQKPIDYTAK
ncbi:cytochrome c3 family protein [Geomonas sp. Red69]|uniref:cytochrome c3 family protein n=1 Tax=Geomonas diazotrophica TaxID=2843197 RepID=UPI001C0FD864|nr:cytochrome c3 family protein [Geomonas diazotrophica]MBU5637964.1 cytochrome c3 family protein [Geomonas diazotrophica]